MRPTATLIAEHELIKQGLVVLSAIDRKMKRREVVLPRDIAGLLRFFRQYADELHHHKEERLLFTALEKAHVRQFDNMVGALITQHFLAREFLASMKQDLADYRLGKRGSGNRFGLQARAYITLMTIHICDEDHVLFPLVDRHVSPHTSRNLTRRFRASDRQQRSTEQSAKFARMVLRMHRKYCSAIA